MKVLVPAKSLHAQPWIVERSRASRVPSFEVHDDHARNAPGVRLGEPELLCRRVSVHDECAGPPEKRERRIYQHIGGRVRRRVHDLLDTPLPR